MVPHTGFEPVISALRGRCPRPLDECGMRRINPKGLDGERQQGIVYRLFKARRKVSGNHRVRLKKVDCGRNGPETGLRLRSHGSGRRLRSGVVRRHLALGLVLTPQCPCAAMRPPSQVESHNFKVHPQSHDTRYWHGLCVSSRSGTVMLGHANVVVESRVGILAERPKAAQDIACRDLAVRATSAQAHRYR